MIGAGYVGLVSGVCFSDFEHYVVCVDKDPTKIDNLQQGEIPIYEPGLKALMAKNVEAGRLSFFLDLEAALDGAAAVFIAVGTTTRRGDGHADLTFVMTAAEEVAEKAKDYLVDVPATWANADLLQTLTGYLPDTGLTEGVVAFVDWYKSYFDIGD